MAFGLPNPFGGSDKDKDKAQAQSQEQDHSAPPSIFGNATSPTSLTGSSASSSEIKSRVQTAIATQSNVANAKALISKINENCFDHCIPAPGSSLSSREQGCLSACMEKYIEAWNVVSRTYVARLQREGAQMNSGTSSQGGLF